MLKKARVVEKGNNRLVVVITTVSVESDAAAATTGGGGGGEGEGRRGAGGRTHRTKSRSEGLVKVEEDNTVEEFVEADPLLAAAGVPHSRGALQAVSSLVKTEPSERGT